MGEWVGYLVFLAALGAVFFLSAAFVLYWAINNGQFKNINKGAHVIFDEEEPEGIHTDYFPGEREKQQRKLKESVKPKKTDLANTKS